MATESADIKKLPQGIQLTPLDETFRTDPYAVLKALRETAPVLEDTELGRFVYTRHDDVKALCHDKEFFTDPGKANPGTFSREVIGGSLGFGEQLSMLFMDEPDHRRLAFLWIRATGSQGSATCPHYRETGRQPIGGCRR